MTSIICESLGFLSSSDRVLLESIIEWYNENPEHIDKYMEIVKRKNGMSLRVIDWLVTNYSKENSIPIETKIDCLPRDLNRDYQKNLTAYNKKNLDPFARKNKISVKILTGSNGEGETRSTTVGQLNFFRWFCKNNLDVYISREKKKIDAHMKESEKNKKHNKKNKFRNKKTFRPKHATSKSYTGTFMMNFDF